MAEIPIEDLSPGSVTDKELFSKNNEVLIKRGVTLNETVISALSRRGVTHVYTHEDDDEIKEILSTKITGMSDLAIEESDGPGYNEDDEAMVVDDAPAKALDDFKELKEVSSGELGYKKILQSTKVQEIDSKIDNIAKAPDLPIGEPVAATAVQKTVEDRTTEYKSSIEDNYQEALKTTEETLTGLRNGARIDGQNLYRIVKKFVETYITDRNILLNISTTKSTTNDYIFNHSLNVCLLSINIAAATGYSKEQVIEIGMGAFLHDIGMMLIPKYIRTKPAALSRDEFYEIRKHPILGLHLLEKIEDLPDSVRYAAYQTHERENGRGYPKERSGRFLHYYARIVMVADVFEALSSPRAYRKAVIPYKAMEKMLAWVRRGQFKSEIVRAFIDYTSLFPVGSYARINNGEICKVVQSNGKAYTKPVLSVIARKDGTILDNPEIRQINLIKNKEVSILQALPFNYIETEMMKGF